LGLSATSLSNQGINEVTSRARTKHSNSYQVSICPYATHGKHSQSVIVSAVYVDELVFRAENEEKSLTDISNVCQDLNLGSWVNAPIPPPWTQTHCSICPDFRISPIYWTRAFKFRRTSTHDHHCCHNEQGATSVNNICDVRAIVRTHTYMHTSRHDQACA
jgi:hypothetical protein